MTANNGWPGKPGVPMNPEQDGWHWLQDSEGNKECVSWRERKFLGDGRGVWSFVGYEDDFQPHEIRDWTYLGPVLTPDEAAALQKRAALLVSIIRRSFCYDDEEDLLRLLARSLCRVEGQDPDAIISVDKGPFDKNWKRFLPQARAALGGKDE